MPFTSSLISGKEPVFDIPVIRTVSWRLAKEIEGLATGHASKLIQCTFFPLKVQGAFKLPVILDATKLVLATA